MGKKCCAEYYCSQRDKLKSVTLKPNFTFKPHRELEEKLQLFSVNFISAHNLYQRYPANCHRDGESSRFSVGDYSRRDNVHISHSPSL